MLKRVKLLVLEVNTLISQKRMLGLIYPVVYFFFQILQAFLLSQTSCSHFSFFSLSFIFH